MKKLAFFMFFAICGSVLFAQTAKQWIQVIEAGARAIDQLKSKNRPSYEISELKDGSYIVYDVYGWDVRIDQNEDAVVKGIASISALDNKYSQMFQELLYICGRPIKSEAASSQNGGNTTAIFDYGLYPMDNGYKQYYLELKLSVYEGELSLRRYSRLTSSQQNQIAQPEKSNGEYKYRILNGLSIRITGYIGTQTDVSIPNTIEGLPVTEIDYGAFIQKKLKSVVLPDSLKSIGRFAFHYNELTRIIFPDGILSIGENAFEGNQLQEVVLPKNLIKIADESFRNNKITSVTIPDSVREINGYAFGGNPVSRITIGANVSYTSNRSATSNPFSTGYINGNYSSLFKAFYEKNNKKAGEYIYINGNWAFFAN